MASSSQNLEELPSIKFTPPYTVPLRLQTYLEFTSGEYYYCGDHVTYCFEHLFKEATEDFLDFVNYSDPTASNPRPQYLTRSEGTQRLAEYLATQLMNALVLTPSPSLPHPPKRLQVKGRIEGK